VLIPAVPVSAITFLSPWRVAQTKRTNAPVATFDPSFGSGETLLVDMGRTTTRGAQSRVEASREFRVDSTSETVSISHVFETLLNDARMSVKMKLKPSGGLKMKTVKFDEKGGRDEVFGDNQEITGLLAPGDYVLKIKIDYKNRDGQWDNSLPRPGSPHTFSIQSL
jgi:hypothetical protein